jgi:hypothetical protein
MMCIVVCIDPGRLWVVPIYKQHHDNRQMLCTGELYYIT